MRFTTSRVVRGTAFLATAAALAFAVVGFRGPESASSDAPKDEWLKGLNGKFRELFDTPAPGDGIPLVHIMNFYDTYNKAYGVKDADIDAILTFYGSTTFHGVNDAMWSKYKIGEFMKMNGPDGQPWTANPWRTAPIILGGPLPAASIEALQKRGTTTILCNNALTIFSGLLAKSRGLEPNVVYEDLKANILPGVELVPGMVVAIQQAQDKGVAYHRQ